MSKYADFHIHSKFSDGKLKLNELEKLFIEKNIKYIAITDHDDVRSSTYEFKKVKNVNGIELSTYLQESEIHLLGYGYKNGSKKLKKITKKIKKERFKRFQRMIGKAKKVGLLEKKIDYISKYNLNPKKDMFGRSTIADIILREKKIRSRRRLYQKYLGDGQILYEPVRAYRVYEGVEILKNECDIVAMAHPQRTNRDELIKKLDNCGMNGLEVFYPFHDSVITDFYLNIAKKYNIIPVGGSDFHGGGLRFQINHEKILDFINYFNLC